jgi:hypothetical protein
MARALRAIVAEIHQIPPTTVPKMLGYLPRQPNELRVTLFQARACQCDGMYDADGKFSFQKRIKF